MLRKILALVLFAVLVPFTAYAFQVEDGKGRGYKQEVNSEHQAVTKAIRETIETHISHDEGEAYFYSSGASVIPSRTIANVGGYIMYVENESTTKELHLEKIMVVSNTSGVTFAMVKNLTLGTITNYDAIEPVNVNFSSGNVSDTTEYTWNETGQGLGGLTGGTTVFTMATPASPVILPIDGTVILQANDNFGLHMSGIAEVIVSIRYYFHE